MFDIGGGEFIFLILLGLLVFGPRRLPEIGRQVGGLVHQLRRSMREFQTTLDREVELDRVKDVAQGAAQQVKALGTQARTAIGIDPAATLANEATRSAEFDAAPTDTAPTDIASTDTAPTDTASTDIASTDTAPTDTASTDTPSTDNTPGPPETRA